MSGKVFEAKEHCKAAEKAMKTSVFRWKPDYDSAADEYSQAAQCYRIARDLPNSKECHLKASECFKKNHAFFHAAKSLENAMIVCKETAPPEEIYNLALEASSLFQQHGSGDSGASVLDKGAKILEVTAPELAVKLFQQAADVSSHKEKEAPEAIQAPMDTEDSDGPGDSSDSKASEDSEGSEASEDSEDSDAPEDMEDTEAPIDTQTQDVMEVLNWVLASGASELATAQIAPGAPKEPVDAEVDAQETEPWSSNLNVPSTSTANKDEDHLYFLSLCKQIGEQFLQDKDDNDEETEKSRTAILTMMGEYKRIIKMENRVKKRYTRILRKYNRMVRQKKSQIRIVKKTLAALVNFIEMPRELN